MPAAVSSGVSYSDFHKMTIGEIRAVIKFADDKIRGVQKLAASTAYSVGAFFHTRRMPETVQTAFPALFGRTSDGQIKAENWRESYAAMEKMRLKFEERKRRCGHNGDG